MAKTAKLFRMLSDQHVCPFGIKAKDLLQREGFTVEDHPLEDREATEAFKADYDVKTTPQIFIDGVRIGGYDDLVAHFGKTTLKQQGTTYQPIIAIFATTFLMAIATVYARTGAFSAIEIAEGFIALSMCVLGIMKLRDLYAFSNQFVTYDLLARRWVRYAYIYPFIETGAGILMIAGWMTIVAAPAALLIGMIGGVSVFKAVYVEKRELKCACVGGDSSVPLGFISLTENVMMVLMALWMLQKLS